MTMITPIDKTDDELFKTLNVVIVLKLDWRLNEVLKLNTQIVKGLKHLRKQITGERDGFLTRDISYFENIYDSLHEDGDAELFLVKLEPQQVLDETNKDLEAQEAEKPKLEAKSEARPNDKKQLTN